MPSEAAPDASKSSHPTASCGEQASLRYKLQSCKSHSARKWRNSPQQCCTCLCIVFSLCRAPPLLAVCSNHCLHQLLSARCPCCLRPLERGLQVAQNPRRCRGCVLLRHQTLHKQSRGHSGAI